MGGGGSAGSLEASPDVSAAPQPASVARTSAYWEISSSGEHHHAMPQLGAPPHHIGQ